MNILKENQIDWFVDCTDSGTRHITLDVLPFVCAVVYIHVHIKNVSFVTSCFG